MNNPAQDNGAPGPATVAHSRVFDKFIGNKKRVRCYYQIDCFDSAIAARLIRYACAAPKVIVECIPSATDVKSLLDARESGIAICIVGVCPPIDVLEQIANQVGWEHILVADHHKPNSRTMFQFQLRLAAHTKMRLAIYKEDQSTCELVWRWLYPDSPVPPIVAAISDVDTGRFKSHTSLPITLACKDWPFMYRCKTTIWEFFHQPRDGDIHTLIERGGAIILEQASQVSRIAQNALIKKWRTIPNVTVAVVLDAPVELYVRISKECERIHKCDCTAFTYGNMLSLMSDYKETGFDTLMLSAPQGGTGDPGASRIDLEPGVKWTSLLVDAPVCGQAPGDTEPGSHAPV